MINFTDPSPSSRGQTSTQVELQESFGLEYLKTVTTSRPIVRPGQVRVSISHSALNYRDLMMVKGQYNPRQSLPLIPCSDGVGKIIEVGEKSPWQGGERVIPLFSQGWREGEPGRHVTDTTLGGPLSGTLRDEGLFNADGVVEVPHYLTDAEASTLGCAALTAWSALVELGSLRSGSHVLCIGTGGVSLFATQIAAISGARVTLIIILLVHVKWVTVMMK